MITPIQLNKIWKTIDSCKTNQQSTNAIGWAFKLTKKDKEARDYLYHMICSDYYTKKHEHER